jgi:hypothetical protein
MMVLANVQIVINYLLFFKLVVFGDLIGFRMLIIHLCVLNKLHAHLFLLQILNVCDNKLKKIGIAEKDVQ